MLPKIEGTPELKIMTCFLKELLEMGITKNMCHVSSQLSKWEIKSNWLALYSAVIIDILFSFD